MKAMHSPTKDIFSFKFREIIYNNVSINILNLLISYNWNSS